MIAAQEPIVLINSKDIQDYQKQGFRLLTTKEVSSVKWNGVVRHLLDSAPGGEHYIARLDDGRIHGKDYGYSVTNRDDQMLGHAIMINPGINNEYIIKHVK